MSRAHFRPPLPGAELGLLALLVAMLACASPALQADSTPAGAMNSAFGKSTAVATLAAASITTATPTLPPPLQTWAAANAPTAQPDSAPAGEQPATLVPPAPVGLRQLTTGGCCSGHFWSADSSRILYIDKPDPAAQSGLWGIDLQPGAAPKFISDRLGTFSPAMDLRAYPFGHQAIIERLTDSQQWVIPSSGRSVTFSLDGKQVAWNAGQLGAPPGPDERRVWISNVDGSDARPLELSSGAGFSAWFPDGRLLVSGPLDSPEGWQALWAVTPLPAGQKGQSPVVELARGERLRLAVLSPDGRWLAYQITFSGDPAQDGLWLVDTRTLQRRRIEPFGAYRWRDNHRLLIAPLDLANPLNSLWQVDAASGALTLLVGPEQAPFKIAAGDWSVSPDGRYVAFLSAQDQNLWLMTLPED